MYPGFLGIGAQKAGTTWLFSNLVNHPEVWLPPVKEVHYFDDTSTAGKKLWWFYDDLRSQLESGEVDFGRLRWYALYALSDQLDDRWYEALFDEGKGKLAGDITPAYAILTEDEVAGVHALMPDAKIIFTMRNPLDRVWSHYKSAILRKSDNPQDLIASKDYLRHIESEESQLRTRYLRTIEIWEKFYPKEQIYYLFFEDIIAQPGKFLEEVCAFLSISYDPAFFPSEERAVNATDKLPLPDDARRMIAALYFDEMTDLAARFDGYPALWRDALQTVLEGKE